MILDFSKKLSNMSGFIESAERFKETGMYCEYPANLHPKSRYMQFWKEEKKRCLYGLDLGYDKIPGYYYFYLNYCPIELVKDIGEVKEGQLVQAERVTSFPNVWDGDYYYFQYLDEAEKAGKHAVVIKCRGRGYSFKGGSMLCRNYFLIPRSKSFAFADEKEYLVSDGVLNKAWDMIGFIDNNTAWMKRRQYKDTDMHKRASFQKIIEGVKTESGYLSEIMGVSFRNSPHKARGKRAKLILWEESGKFPSLLQAWQIARSSVEQGSRTFGLMVSFGTGGTQDADFEGLIELFENPKGYNIYSIPNVWSSHRADKECGYFVPEYMNREGHYDENGNSDIESAKKEELKNRETIKLNTGNRYSYTRYVAEKPFTPEEATLRISGNIFPELDLKERLAYLETHEEAKNLGQIGMFVRDDSGLPKWKQNDKLVLCDFPVNSNDKGEGAIVIWEHPPKDNIPYGLYIAGMDSYDFDESTTTSLGSIFIYKRLYNMETWYDTIVAEYTGRAKSAEDYYENARRLLEYYNAVCLYENQNPGFKMYLEKVHSLNLLKAQPGIIKNIIIDSKVDRTYGVHMVVKVKDYLEVITRDWLVEEYAQGKRNLSKIYSTPLIKELIAYNKEGNYDRVIAFMLCMLHNEDLHRVHVDRIEEKIVEEFFERSLFL